MHLSRLVPVVQTFAKRGLPDVSGAVRAELSEKRTGAELPKGTRIAVGVGSRGVSNLSTIVRSTVAHFQSLGLEPFVIPAMGSHGGGTAAGQIDVLAHYDVTEAKVGCPIVSSMDVVPLGSTPEGIETFMDRNAYECAGVFLINRVKWHTTFDAPIESGLMKMAGIGVGKLEGATNYHRHGVRMGLGNVVQAVGRHVLKTGKILGGLAVLEDAHHATGKVAAVRAENMEQEEQKLLELARSWMARILFDEVDILIVDEVGKHISGVGMDSKVVNRHPYGGVNPWPWAPRIHRIYVRDISPMSYGNAVGMGLSDVISERFYSKIDWHATKVNSIASSNLCTIRTPLRAASDKEALEILTAVVGRSNPSEATFVWIRNTLELANIAVSENLLQHAREGVEVAGPPVDWQFQDGEALCPAAGVFQAV